MADESKEVAETLKTPQEERETPETPSHIDYKADLEETKARLAKAEAIIQRHSKKPVESEDETEQPAIDLDSIRSAIRQEVDELKSSLSSQFRTREIQDAVQKMASDPHEAELIRFHYDNSIRQTGDLALDMENAKALANKKRVQYQIDELRASHVSKETRSAGSGAGQKPKTEDNDEALPPLTEVDRQSVDALRKQYVISNSAIRRILKGDRLDDLLDQGIIKKR